MGKTESGVHGIVRISPFEFNLEGTSFASIWVYPEINNDIDIEIEDKDLRIDTYGHLVQVVSMLTKQTQLLE